MYPRRKLPIKISGGFWLLLGWFLLGNGWEMLAVILTAACIHEAGHWLVLRLLGAEVRFVSIGVLGAEMQMLPGSLSYGRELTAVLAGPAANLLCGTVLIACGTPWLPAAGAHFALAGFNLLPIRPLDGGRALQLAAMFLVGPEAGERIARWTGCYCALGLAVCLTAVMWRSGGSLWLLPPAAAALAAAVREAAGK
ncbi:hypothetical protein [uncultured Oscillibacter sp.]|uniref:hypothetical protein n=1 Tax=uncultured Oscillibacter sp. TaxID=876091 RepID=UPI00280ACA8B|nr:hypothetical protein [uncultured Oscillibacter sp.]